MATPLNTDWFPEARVGERTRELLENFDVIGGLQDLVIVPRGKHSETLRDNVRAAVVASMLGLRSLDYAKRSYCEPGDSPSPSDPGVKEYIATYSVAKAYILDELAKLDTQGRPDPSLGVFGASMVLERLPASFFCAHFLYRLGHNYEGHAVARLILEQIAWAYVAYPFDDLDSIAKIETTGAITQLKRFAPGAGKIYGFLSRKTHIDYSTHREFMRIEKGRNVVLHAQPKFGECARCIVLLADLFGLVWELSQFSYIATPEAVVLGKDGLIPNPERSFLNTMHQCIEVLEKALGDDKLRGPRQRG